MYLRIVEVVESDVRIDKFEVMKQIYYQRCVYKFEYINLFENMSIKFQMKDVHHTKVFNFKVVYTRIRTCVHSILRAIAHLHSCKLVNLKKYSNL